MASRSAQIVRASAVNIAGNVVLSVFKLIIGLVSNSAAITADAVNNFTDALSSVVAIGGAKLAGRRANSKHPFGYGRMEYIATVAIAALIIAAGVTTFLGSIAAIIRPPELDYRPIMLLIVSVACAVKIALGFYLRRVGRRINSDGLMGSGFDAMTDAFISAATIVAAVIHLHFHVAIEPWLGIAIALIIGKAGIELLFSTVSKLLGERVDSEIFAQVEAAACEVEGVKLASGLVLQDHGPERLHGSLYITVDGSMPIEEFDEVAREVQRHVSEKCGVKLTTVGAYPAGTDDPGESEARAEIGRLVWMHNDVVEVRGLFADADQKFVRFDAVADFSRRDFDELRKELTAECQQALPDWTIEVRVLPDI